MAIIAVSADEKKADNNINPIRVTLSQKGDRVSNNFLV
jgi:hypothetical protein